MDFFKRLSARSILTLGILTMLIIVGGGLALESRVQVVRGNGEVQMGTGTGVESSALAIETQNRNAASLRNTPLDTSGTVTTTQSSSRLVIPKIGVDANIQTAGLTKTGTIGIPTNFTDVAWYNGSAKLGSNGVSIIDGHLDGRNTPRAVFYNLAKLSPGDLVKVMEKDGTIYSYKVSRIEVFDYKSNPQEIFKDGDKKGHLNLITCTGDWVKSEKTYDERVVVFTDLVS